MRNLTAPDIEKISNEIADRYMDKFVRCCVTEKAKQCVRDAAQEILCERFNGVTWDDWIIMDTYDPHEEHGRA